MPRWKRSKIRARSASGMPGPESSTVSATRLPSRPTRHATVPPSGEYLQALSRSTPSRRSSHSGGAVTTGCPARTSHGQFELARLGDGRRTGPRSGREHAEVDRLGVGWAARRVEARQPEHVLEQPAHPLRLAVDPLERLRYHSSSRSCASARLVCASITDSGVRSSCDASAVNSSCRRRAALDRARRPAGRSRPRRGTRPRAGAARSASVAEDDRPLRVADAVHRLRHDDPSRRRPSLPAMRTRVAGDRGGRRRR